MPTRRFQKLIEAIPIGRRQKIAKRVRLTVEAVHLDEGRKASETTKTRPKR